MGGKGGDLPDQQFIDSYLTLFTLLVFLFSTPLYHIDLLLLLPLLLQVLFLFLFLHLRTDILSSFRNWLGKFTRGYCDARKLTEQVGMVGVEEKVEWFCYWCVLSLSCRSLL